METVAIELPFGRDGVFRMGVPAALVAVYHRGPQGLRDVAVEAAAALSAPLDFPALGQAVLAEDRIVLALDRDIPEASQLILAIWNVLTVQGVQAKDVVILQPAALDRQEQADPRGKLPEEIREQIAWVRHDATPEGQFAYLATTTGGERVYLAASVVNADFVLPIGSICYDPVIGHRGTSSVLYPGLSSQEALARSHGQGHDELEPGDLRGLRQTIDEVGWLLGVQFAVQVLPGVGGTAAAVLAGAADSVFHRGKQFLEQQWQVSLEERVELVIVAVEEDAAGHGWRQIGAALETARRLVTREGSILVLSQLDAPLTPGLELLQASRTPRDALLPLRQSAPEDLVVATQFAKAADWATVYLLSDLDSDTVEDLFAVPLDTTEEARRLVERGDRMAVIGSAQHVYAQVRSG